jgi:hypothetical protein
MEVDVVELAFEIEAVELALVEDPDDTDDDPDDEADVALVDAELVAEADEVLAGRVLEAEAVFALADCCVVTPTVTTCVEEPVTWAVATTTFVVTEAGCTVTVWTLVVSTSESAATGAQKERNGANSLSIYTCEVSLTLSTFAVTQAKQAE